MFCALQKLVDWLQQQDRNTKFILIVLTFPLLITWYIGKQFHEKHRNLVTLSVLGIFIIVGFVSSSASASQNALKNASTTPPSSSTSLSSYSISSKSSVSSKQAVLSSSSSSASSSSSSVVVQSSVSQSSVASSAQRYSEPASSASTYFAPSYSSQQQAPQLPTTSGSSGYIDGTCKYLATLGMGNFVPGDPNYTSARDKDKDGIACEL